MSHIVDRRQESWQDEPETTGLKLSARPSCGCRTIEATVSFVRQTPTQRLASLLLQQPVTDWIADRRDAGTSWRLIARELHTSTQGQIDVTAETLRGWTSERAA